MYCRTSHSAAIELTIHRLHQMYNNMWVCLFAIIVLQVANWSIRRSFRLFLIGHLDWHSALMEHRKPCSCATCSTVLRRPASGAQSARHKCASSLCPRPFGTIGSLVSDTAPGSAGAAQGRTSCGSPLRVRNSSAFPQSTSFMRFTAKPKDRPMTVNAVRDVQRSGVSNIRGCASPSSAAAGMKVYSLVKLQRGFAPWLIWVTRFTNESGNTLATTKREGCRLARSPRYDGMSDNAQACHIRHFISHSDLGGFCGRL